MARVEVALAAVEDLDRLIRVLSLPPSTRERVRRSIHPLARFPRLGSELEGRWSGFRFLLGPWRWMLIVYTYDADADRVVVVTIQGARCGDSPAATRS
jgi:plasmid stabilization system protein ParE